MLFCAGEVHRQYCQPANGAISSRRRFASKVIVVVSEQLHPMPENDQTWVKLCRRNRSTSRRPHYQTLKDTTCLANQQTWPFL